MPCIVRDSLMHSNGLPIVIQCTVRKFSLGTILEFFFCNHTLEFFDFFSPPLLSTFTQEIITKNVTWNLFMSKSLLNLQYYSILSPKYIKEISVEKSWRKITEKIPDKKQQSLKNRLAVPHTPCTESYVLLQNIITMKILGRFC